MLIIIFYQEWGMPQVFSIQIFFLYPAAVLRAAFFSNTTAYIVYLVGINFVTFLIAFKSFESFSHDWLKSFLFSVLYGCASYRLSDLTERGALGEVLALTFLPIAFVGVYHIFIGHSKKWVLLSIGMSCLFFTHMLTAVIFSFFILFFIILNMDVVFEQKKRMLDFGKAILLTLPLVAVFLLPMLEQLTDQSYYFQEHPMMYLHEGAGSITEYLTVAMRNQGHNNLGVLTLLALAIIGLHFKALSKFSRQLLILSVVFLIMSTNLFPHVYLSQTILNVMQFPWRFFLLITLCTYWVLAAEWDYLFPIAVNRWIPLILIVSTLGVAIAHSIQVPKKRKYEHYVYDFIDSGYLGWGSEYLPIEMDAEEIVTQKPTFYYDPNKVTLTDIDMGFGEAMFTFESETPTKVILPFVYYKGYEAEGEGQFSKITGEDPDYPGYCSLSVEGTGKIRVTYKETMLQKASLSISVITWILLGSVAGYGYMNRRKE
ncbi:hypothetical protein [uncultured Enterococcus sp.]|uniref:hypothetical protein n=1 Tax=uncultured Enterococcus sp. TaxID=167972 RepID=UPI002AA81F0A|nr:hypothetical protein [uncultured Enterococcus sp.]